MLYQIELKERCHKNITKLKRGRFASNAKQKSIIIYKMNRVDVSQRDACMFTLIKYILYIFHLNGVEKQKRYVNMNFPSPILIGLAIKIYNYN